MHFAFAVSYAITVSNQQHILKLNIFFFVILLFFQCLGPVVYRQLKEKLNLID